MQRLYVGGLSHTVTQKDLKDRFGKFGEVQDVELRTRRDEEGIPHKTFGYINIDISEAELKRCMTVLNKSKWKGGTLQIEIAKESFLHRLTQERQEAMEQRLQPPAAEDKRQKLLDSLSKAGVDNFTMKAAVPGTEVPGHKNWVVSKFGRVLPILQLRCKKGNRARTVKYDPSKYSHNIRKLGPVTVDQSTPVTQLTWEVQGGDDDISKKRRGEFPPYEPPGRKKSRTDKFNSRNDTNRSRLEKTLQSDNTAKTQHVTNGFEKPANSKPVQRKSAALLDSDDSDEEIRRLMAAHNTSSSAPSQVVEEDNLEVVGLDYLVKSGRSGQQQKGGPTDEEEDDYDSADTDELFASRRPPPASAAHMQEKQTVPKANHLSGNNTDRKRKTKKKSKSGSKEEGEDDDSADAEEHITSRKPSTAQQRWDYGKQTSENQGSSSGNQSKKMVDLSDVKSDFSESDSDEDDENEGDKELESSASCSDSEYEAMFSNVTCLEISFTDLQRLAEESQPTPETTIPSILGVDPEKETSLISEHTGPKRGTTPEEILASIMEDESTDDEKRTKKRKSKCVASTLLPAFQGTKTLNEKLESSDQPNRQNKGEENGGVVKKQKLDFETPQRKTESTSGSSEQDEEEHEGKIEVVKNIAAVKVFEKVPNNVPVNAKKLVHSSSSGSDDDEEEEEEKKEERKNANQTLISAKVGAEASPSSSSTSHKEDEDVGKTATPPASHSNSSSSDGGESSSSSEEEEEEEASHPSRVTLRAEEEEEQQRKANMRRLAAIQQKLKEAEEHKRLIQGALANLDTPTQGAGKHIVFGSDDEEEEEDDGEDKDQQQTPSEITVSKKTLFQDDQSEEEAMSEEASATDNTLDKKLSGSQLFGGSEDEEESDEEEDGNRFEIRPQFEGRAGQKLMELQSRFGTDERFRMDSRFLEEDDKEEESETQVCMTEVDQALEEERKKNLSILQSILGGSQQTYSTKTSSKAKTFRDVSALHYDPSKEEHAAFETKPEESKESKSARRRKREEALKLPEVSKEIYYDVSGDLKAVFGPTQDDGTEGQKSTSWDQEEEEVKGGEGEAAVLSSLVSADPVVEKEEAGFKFSFFGDDAETVNEETMEYKVESIQAPKVSWQQDLRFQDSSSEEDEDEDGQEEDEEQSRATPKTAEEVTPSKTTLFFFYHEDCRLAEGPRLFCRSSQLEEQRDQWEERRSELRQEYRKKHKDARRKLKSSMKT